MKKELKIFLILLGVFLLAYLVPWESSSVRRAGLESFLMMQDYAREHVLLCLVPAFFIAGAIGVFVSQQSVMKYFGPLARKVLSYGVASVSGSVLAVCSCTVLPLFTGIYMRGAGLGPACCFLYSGPAINVLAIILTARVLGLELGIARAIGAVLFSIVIGLLMHFFYRKEEKEKAEAAQGFAVIEEEGERPLWKTAVYFAAMIGILVFANWGRPGDVIVNKTDGSRVEGIRASQTSTELALKTGDAAAGGIVRIPTSEIENVEYAPSVYSSIFKAKFYIAGAFLILLLVLVFSWFKKQEIVEWGGATWGFAKQIFPLLFAGVIVAGFLLGRPGHQALIPEEWIASLVGGNSVASNFLASVSGAFMYFATLTEVPILQGLMGSGMGKGPALALLLSGPALSLPSMLVIRSVLGTRKTLVFIALVVALSTLAGLIYGSIF
jgi:uncharacterized membrane protein YraQ (UPF0718 family)